MKKVEAEESDLSATLCVGEYLISKINENTIWLRKKDGEGGGFDTGEFEKCLSDFFDENF